MALLKGKGAMTGVNLLAKVYDNGATKDGKTHYVDVQVDARDARGPEQTNLHLKSERIKSDDPKRQFNNGAPYSTSDDPAKPGQLQEIIKAAGDNKTPILDKDGAQVGTVYAVKANVMPASRGTGLVINTKTVEASDFVVDANTLDNQFESMRAAKAAQAEAKAAQAEATPAPEAEQAVEQVVEQTAEVEEPAVG